jgi:hypothetical protein
MIIDGVGLFVRRSGGVVEDVCDEVPKGFAGGLLAN